MSTPPWPSSGPILAGGSSSQDIYEKLILKLASLEKFQRTMRESRTMEESILRGLEEVERLIRFHVAGFYLVGSAGDFELALAAPQELSKELDAVVSSEIERGTFAWALRHTRPIVVQGTTPGRQVLLSALTTPARILGMFIGVIDNQDVRAAEDVQGLLSLMLLGVTYTIENQQLLNELRTYNEHLQELVDQRTKEIREANEEIIKTNRDLESEIVERERRELELQAAKAAAEDAGRAKGEFLAVMSHEIRTPMSGVIGFANLLENTKLDEEQTELVQQINSSGEQLVSLLNDVLDFSKIEAGRLVLERQNVKFRELLAAQVKFIYPRCTDKGVEVTFDVSEDVPQICIGDSTRLRQIVTNLLNNALKFTEKGEIIIHLSVVEQANRPMLLCVIEDTGIGIPTEKIDRLFKPFSQADSSTNRRYGGTGLGLAICQRLCELMGGKIWVESEHGLGSRFAFSIPLIVESAQAVVSQHPFLIGKKAYFASSNPLQQNIRISQLSRWGMEVVGQSPNIYDFLEGPKVSNIDLFLLDGSVFGLPPQEIIPKFRENSPAAIVLVQCITRKLRGEIEEMNDKSLHCLLKPISPEMLLSTLSQFWSNHDPAQPPASLTPENHSEQTALDPLKILIVDDTRTNLMVGSRLISALGHDVETVESAEDCFKKIRNKAYDLVLMDVNMPDIDGIEATSQIRNGVAGEHNRAIFICAWTALATVENRSACLNVGMNDFLVKPISMFELRRVLALCIKKVV